MKLGGRMDKSLTNFLDRVRETFEANLLRDSYKNAVINVSLTIVQAHGSLRSVILNAISLALIDAGIEMKDIVVSCSAGYIQQFPGLPVLDLSASEENANKGMLVLGYSANRDKVLLLEMTNGKVPIDEILALTDTSVQGSKQIFKQLKQFLKSNYALKSQLSRPIKISN
jgi:exosome complex component RRP41